MRIHLAGIENLDYIDEINEYKPPYLLFSYYYLNSKNIDPILSTVKKPFIKSYLVDSGAFSFLNGEKENEWKDWLKYCDMYADFVRNSQSPHYFEMDVDNILGLEKVEILRKRIESRVGWQSIPVWHFKRGWKYFERMCDEYSYVAVGGNANLVDGVQISNAFQYFTDYAHRHGVQVHGLGFTNLKKLKSIPFDSVDSTTWLSGKKYGHILKIVGDSLIYKNPKKEGYRMNGYKASAHNLKLMAQYAKSVDR